MNNDPLIEEAREAGRRYLESFHGNKKAMVEDLNKRSAAAGRKTAEPRAIKPAEQESNPSR